MLFKPKRLKAYLYPFENSLPQSFWLKIENYGHKKYNLLSSNFDNFI